MSLYAFVGSEFFIALGWGNRPKAALKTKSASTSRAYRSMIAKYQEMNIPYRKVADETRPDGFSFYPLLRVFLRHGVNMRNVLALVDSGAVDCVFPASIGELLGVDVPSGKPHAFHGFDLTEVQGYVHNVNLQVEGFPHWISVDAVFLQSEGPSILGQNGFFESYQVIF